MMRRARAGGALSARYHRGVLLEILEQEAALLIALESSASRPCAPACHAPVRSYMHVSRYGMAQSLITHLAPSPEGAVT